MQGFRKLHVSIPNGMEFYAHLAPILTHSVFVSIPNGMEFYLAPKSGDDEADEGFNSQRDEILLFQPLLRYRHTRVSIPNGMEFYIK